MLSLFSIITYGRDKTQSGEPLTIHKESSVGFKWFQLAFII